VGSTPLTKAVLAVGGLTPRRTEPSLDSARREKRSTPDARKFKWFHLAEGRRVVGATQGSLGALLVPSPSLFAAVPLSGLWPDSGEMLPLLRRSSACHVFASVFSPMIWKGKALQIVDGVVSRVAVLVMDFVIRRN
jgi:hypothetical protein